jgi:hypothetical protein
MNYHVNAHLTRNGTPSRPHPSFAQKKSWSFFQGQSRGAIRLKSSSLVDYPRCMRPISGDLRSARTDSNELQSVRRGNVARMEPSIPSGETESWNKFSRNTVFTATLNPQRIKQIRGAFTPPQRSFELALSSCRRHGCSLIRLRCFIFSLLAAGTAFNWGFLSYLDTSGVTNPPAENALGRRITA